MIRIRSKIDGFRRCGVPHPGEWTEHEDGRFTPEQMEILKSEPMLQVEAAAPEDMTKAQIAAQLTAMGVDVPRAANKSELQILLDQARAAAAKPGAPVEGGEG